MSQNVITILLADYAQKHGSNVSTLVQAMLLYGEAHTLANTTETDDVVEQAHAYYHYRFAEAPGGPEHDYNDCPHR